MRCLHCGKRLPVLRKLIDGEFCSDQHRKRFQEEQEALALARLIESGERVAGARIRCSFPADSAFLHIQTPFVHIRPSARGMRASMKYRLAALAQVPGLILPSGLLPEASLLNRCSFLLSGVVPAPWGTDEPWRSPLSVLDIDPRPQAPGRRLLLSRGLAIASVMAADLCRPAEGRILPSNAALLLRWAEPATAPAPFVPVSGLSTLAPLLRAQREVPSAASFLDASIQLSRSALPSVAAGRAVEFVPAPTLVIPARLASPWNPALSLGALIGLMVDYRQVALAAIGVSTLPDSVAPVFPSMPICPQELALRQAGLRAVEPAALDAGIVRTDTAEPLPSLATGIRYPAAPALPACGEPAPAPDLLPQIQQPAATVPAPAARPLEALLSAGPLVLAPGGECRRPATAAPVRSLTEATPDPIEEPLALQEPVPARGSGAPLAVETALLDASADLCYPAPARLGDCAVPAESLPDPVEEPLALREPMPAHGNGMPLAVETAPLVASADLCHPAPARLGDCAVPAESLPDPAEEPLALCGPVPARGNGAPLAVETGLLDAGTDLCYPAPACLGEPATVEPSSPDPSEYPLALAEPPATRGSEAPLPAAASLLDVDPAVCYPAGVPVPAALEPAIADGLLAETFGERASAAGPRQPSLAPLPARRPAECLPGGPDPILMFEAPAQDPDMAEAVVLPIWNPRSTTIRLAARLRPEPPCEAPYAPTIPPEHSPIQPALPAAASIGLDVPAAPETNAVPIIQTEFEWPSSEPVRPVLRLRPVPPPTASREDGVQPEAAPGSTVELGWRPLVHFWKQAPADLRWITLVLPIVLVLGLSHGVHRIKLESRGDSAVGSVVKARWEDVRQTIIRRAAIELQEDFHSGLSNWEGKGQWAREWKYDDHGSVRPGSLALFQPSMGLTDYRFEFLGQIQSKSMGWVYRASDTENYYVTKIVLTKPGPLPSAAIVRYAVIHGKEGPRKSTPLPIQVRPDMMYRVRVDVSGPNFTTWVQGQLADFWSDDRLKGGGIGFFSGKGESALLRWVEVSHQYDTLGRLCAFLAPYSVPTRDGSLNP